MTFGLFSFVCSACSLDLRSAAVYSKDEKLFCEQHYKEKFLSRCEYCHEYITEVWTRRFFGQFWMVGSWDLTALMADWQTESNDGFGQPFCRWPVCFVVNPCCLGLISSTFYALLLRPRIPKSQKDTYDSTEFLRFWYLQVLREMLIKLTPGLKQTYRIRKGKKKQILLTLSIKWGWKVAQFLVAFELSSSRMIIFTIYFTTYELCKFRPIGGRINVTKMLLIFSLNPPAP